MDPFDQTGSYVNPSTFAQGNQYQNLMNFGAATMAGSGLPSATAIGKGILAAGDTARENSNSRSHQQYESAQTATANMGNQMQLLNMNLLRKHYGQPPLTMGPNGQLMEAPDTQPSSTKNSASSPRESQGMTGASWAPTPGSTRLNSGPMTNAYHAGSSGEPPTDFNASIAQAESGNRDYNANGSAVTSPKGAKYKMQVMPSTAADPGFGVAPAANDSAAEYDRVGREYATALQNKYNDPRLAAAAYNAGPGRVDQVLANLPQETQNYVPQVVPQQGNQQGQQPQQNSSDIYAAPQGVDPAKWDQSLMLNSLGNPYGKASLESMAKAPYQTIEARQGGIAYNPGLGITAHGRYEAEKSSGAKYITQPGITGPNGQISPPQSGPFGQSQDTQSKKWPVPVSNPATPFGIGSGETLSSLPDYVMKWRDENYPAMSRLQVQMQQQSAIDNSISNLKNADMLQPGSWGEERLALANAWNTANRALGLPDIDSEKVGADAAEFIKAAQQNTNAAAHEISSRGTNFDIVSAARANPQYTMPYLSALITNSMNSEAVVRNYNRIQYIDDRINHGVLESQATAEFEQQQPGDLVVKRAESSVNPVKANKVNINKLLPGTRVVGPSGQTAYIPIPENYPFMVPYTNPLVKSQRGSE